MTILSLLAIMAHFCMFSMQAQPLTYLLYLLYFRSRHCEKEISWKHLNGGDFAIDAQLPRQADAVTRTFLLGIHQLILNLCLTLAAIGCLRE